MLHLQQDEIYLRKPQNSDGYKIHNLISKSPPLDLNSVYSYYLLCEHFSESCIVAEYKRTIVGFISAYHLPVRKNTLFIWQVVVDQSLRGQKLATRMLDTLLQRLEHTDLRYAEVTVNPGNAASRHLFERLAQVHRSTVEEQTFLEAKAFGSDNIHESEILLRIPLNTTN